MSRTGFTTPSGDVFEVHTDMIDVSMLHRPDTAWKHVDANGHAHRWHVTGHAEPATSYAPPASYETPSLVWVKDGEEYWEDDDEPHDVGHLECRECGEHVSPGYTSDTTQQMIPGLRHYRINGQSVTREDFERRWRSAHDKA